MEFRRGHKPMHQVVERVSLHGTTNCGSSLAATFLRPKALMKYPHHLTRFFASVACLCGLLLVDFAEAKNLPCASVRGRSTYKIESRCVNLKYGDAVRTYRLYAAPSSNRAPMPVLLILHGGGGSGGAMEGMSLGQFNRIADRHRAVILYPDGVGRNWNDGRSDLHAQAVQEGVDDVGFLRAVVEDAGTRFPIDRKRIYAAGISNGGLMSYRLACDAANFFAAVVPVAANLSVELAAECRPSRAVPVAIINGTDDPIMPWIGGEIKVPWNRRGEVLSAQESFERWIKIGDCALPVTHMAKNQSPDDGTSLVRHVARECKDGGEVRLYEILG